MYPANKLELELELELEIALERALETQIKMRLASSSPALSVFGLELRPGLRYVHALCLAGLVGGFNGQVQAQTILEYSRVQRAALEAEVAKNNAKAMGPASAQAVLGPMPPSSPEPLSTRPPPIDSPYPPDLPPPLVVNGAMILPSRALAEVQVAGVSHYLSEGDLVPGTHWSVSKISAKQVTLALGSPGKRSEQRRTFKFPIDPQNITPARAPKQGQ